jgi:hypothetical protein
MLFLLFDIRFFKGIHESPIVDLSFYTKDYVMVCSQHGMEQ